jgi:hypothetical protein
MSKLYQVPELTEEQKLKLKKLGRKTAFNGALIGLKLVGLLFLFNTAVVAINLAFVNSSAFVFIGAALNAIVLFRVLRLDLDKQRGMIAEDIRKILNS